jgi:hypothetical protein
MSEYTPPPGVYFLDTFVLYQAVGNLLPAIGSRSSTRVAENFVADIAIVGWFPDFKLFGADPGFAVTVPFASNRATANFTLVAPIGPAQRFSFADEIFAIGDTEDSAILGWHAGEQHWNVILTGFASTGNFEPNRVSLTGLNRPALDPSQCVRGQLQFVLLRPGPPADHRRARQGSGAWPVAQIAHHGRGGSHQGLAE